MTIMTRAQLLQMLESRAKNTPYRVEPTEQGFVLTLDLADATYYSLMYKNGLKKAFKIEAIMHNAAHTVETTDTVAEIEWKAGSSAGEPKPTVSFSKQSFRGEYHGFESRRIIAFSETGALGEVVNYSYSSDDAKKWLEAQLASAGWRRVWGKSAKIGLVFGIIGIVGSLLTIIVLIVAFIFFPEQFKN